MVYRRWLGFGLMTFSITLSAVGQLCMKAGMKELADAGQSIATFAGFVFSSSFVWTGVGLLSYGLSMIAWLGVLVRLPLSFAYPLLSLSYVLVYVGATQWPRLLEPATPLRTIGTMLIIVGVALVSRSENAAREELTR